MSDKDKNGDMFGFKDITMDDLEKLTDEEEQERWPEVMRQMYDLLKYELENEGLDADVAIKQLNSICKVFGGMQFYLPKGRILEGMITQLHIWNEYTGNNVAQLSRKYDVSMQHIYRVVAKMRNIEKKKRQLDMFDYGE